MKPTLVLKAKHLHALAQRIANRCGVRVVKGPVPNPTLVHHGLVDSARWHIMTHEPPRKAVADLYVGSQAQANRIGRLLANLLGQQLAILDNTATPADLRAHPRSIAAPNPKGLTPGTRVSAVVYGEKRQGTVIEQGRGGIVWVRWDGSPRKAWMHRKSLTVVRSSNPTSTMPARERARRIDALLAKARAAFDRGQKSVAQDLYNQAWNLGRRSNPAPRQRGRKPGPGTSRQPRSPRPRSRRAANPARRDIPPGKVILAEYGSYPPEDRVTVTELAKGWSPRVRAEVVLVTVSPGYERAGSVARWTNGYHAVWWFEANGSRHGQQYKELEKARAHFDRLMTEENRRRDRSTKRLSVPDQHRLKIARQTLRMNDVFARVMGGMTKDEARRVILELTGRPARETNLSGKQRKRAAASARTRARRAAVGERISRKTIQEDYWIEPSTPAELADDPNSPYRMVTSGGQRFTLSANDAIRAQKEGLKFRPRSNPSRSKSARARRSARRSTVRRQGQGIGGRRTIRALGRGQLRRAQYHAVQSKHRYQRRHAAVSNDGGYYQGGQLASDGWVEMTRAQWAKIHRDFKHYLESGVPSILGRRANGGTTLFSVRIIDAKNFGRRAPKKNPSKYHYRGPSIDHSLLSPSGRMSKRAREAAMKREAARLFPPGLMTPTPPTEVEKARALAKALRRSAADLRALAARGMSPRKFTKDAARLEAEAAGIDPGESNPKARKRHRNPGDYVPVAEAAKQLRVALKRHFPGIKFSVRSKSYAGGASIRVAYDNGPRSADVDRIAQRFAGADFDGMTDLKTSRDSLLVGADGAMRSVRYGSDFVFVNREVSPTLEAAVIAQIGAKWSPSQWATMPSHEKERMARRGVMSIEIPQGEPEAITASHAADAFFRGEGATNPRRRVNPRLKAGDRVRYSTDKIESFRRSHSGFNYLKGDPKRQRADELMAELLDERGTVLEMSGQGYKIRWDPSSKYPNGITSSTIDYMVTRESDPLLKGTGRRPNPRGVNLERAVETFRTWQDRNVEPRLDRMKKPEPLPDAAAELGKLVAVTYRSDKYDGKTKDHEHVFKQPLASLVTDPGGRDLHVVRGRSRYAITSDGIRN